jgi:hypothetical protein
MNPVTKRDVRIRVAPDIEPFRLAKLLRIAVGRADHRQHDLPGHYPLAVHLHVMPGGAIRPLYG